MGLDHFKTKQIELIITGSSSKLLSTEINTSLRGRSLAIEVMPFSFEEYKIAHDMLTSQSPFSRQKYDVAVQQMKVFF